MKKYKVKSIVIGIFDIMVYHLLYTAYRYKCFKW